MTESPEPKRRRRFIVAAALLPLVLVAGVELVLRIAGLGAGAVRLSTPQVDLATAQERQRNLRTDGYDGARRVSLADAWAAFRASGRGDADRFVDFCHATPLGNELTANAVLEALGRLPSPTR